MINKNIAFGLGTFFILSIIGLLGFAASVSPLVEAKSSSTGSRILPICGQVCGSDADCRVPFACGSDSYCSPASAGVRTCVPGVSCTERRCNSDLDCRAYCGEMSYCDRSNSPLPGTCVFTGNTGKQ